MARRIFCILMVVLTLTGWRTANAADKDDDGGLSAIYAGLELRALGPGTFSGRISDFAFIPGQPQAFYVATASSGVWKTQNAGITWASIFDQEGSFAIGVIELDPRDSNVVWVGTGENNSQRSVGYGDGVYKSLDGGKNWNNLGLSDSGHISQILIDPRDSDTVYVAAQGPLWNSGGDRGLYKTTDGGATWNRILHIDRDTGVNEVVMKGDNPDHLIASSYQRRRHVWTLINGGPGSGLHKSTDGGKTWRKLTNGLPKGDMGRIGLAASQTEPGVVYAIAEGSKDEQGVYRSDDFGETWDKRSDYMTSSPQYYNEIFVDPARADRLYLLDTRSKVSEDGGKTFTALSTTARHVDDHALWIDPANPDHLYVGGDGGVYETYDRGGNWRHIRNLPITQFYRATPDNDLPFYNVYGGTQDNLTFGGPSRTRNNTGIVNTDWFATVFGDGFKAQIDPTDPNVIYGQLQYGNLYRYDKRTAESVYITPPPPAGAVEYRWNWNAPLIISPHNPSRLYYGAEKIFRSDDRGESWRVISPDLSRGLDRNALKVMGRIWGPDTIAKNKSTSFYGSLIAIAESPLVEGLIYAGSDDGLIQVSGDGGTTWRKESKFRGVPDMSLVEDIAASNHDADVAYAVFDNHKKGDFKPYVYRTADRGKSWKAITGNLPQRGTAHTIVEDHVDPGLLFVGTEFGLFFTQDTGKTWVRLKGNFPTIAVRDLEIQRRETDLVVATFGRGIYILDDYSPLRLAAKAVTSAEATLFPVKEALLYAQRPRWGLSAKSSFGDAFYVAPNPPFGAIFTYHLKDGLQTAREARREAEKKIEKDGGDTPYPGWDALRAEDREQEPAILLTVRDGQGNIVRRITGPAKGGLHRVAWDLHYTSFEPAALKPDKRSPWRRASLGPFALPGAYSVSLAKRQKGEVTQLAGPVKFEVTALNLGTFEAKDRAAVLAFQQKTGRLQGAVLGTIRFHGELSDRLALVKKALESAPLAAPSHIGRARDLETKLADLKTLISGDAVRASRSAPATLSLASRLSAIVGGGWDSLAAITQSHRRGYAALATELAPVLAGLKTAAADLAALEQDLDSLAAPWTPGRLPVWKPE